MQNAKEKKGRKRKKRNRDKKVRQEGATTKVQASTDLYCDFWALVLPINLKIFKTQSDSLICLVQGR